MRHALLSLCAAMMFIFSSLGLQSHGLSWLPSFPALWIVFFVYFVFHRSLTQGLFLGLGSSVLIAQFTTLPIFYIFIALLISIYSMTAMNVFFKLSLQQKVLLVGPIGFLILLTFELSLGKLPHSNFWFPNILVSFLTALSAPVVFFPLHRVDRRYRLDPLDSMEIYI